MSEEMHLPGAPVIFEQQATIVPGEYLPAHRMTDQEIQAGEQTGDLVPWRIDASGEQWYRRVKATGAAALQPIHGVPNTENFID